MVVKKQFVVFQELEEAPAIIERRKMTPGSNVLSVETISGRVKMNVRKGHSFIDVAEISDAGYVNEEELYRDDEGITEEELKKHRWIFIWNAYFLKELRVPYKVRYIVWECGGGYTNTGESQVICGCDGAPLKPLFVRSRGHLACLDHAAFAVWEGQKVVVIRTDHHREQFNVRLDELIAHRENVELEKLWEGEDFYIDEIDEVLPEKMAAFRDAILAAMGKALCYHCREPHYILEK